MTIIGSTVGVAGAGDVTSEEIRKSMLYKEKILVGFKYSDTNPIDQLAADTLLPSYIDGEMLGHIISYSREGNHNEWSLLRYDEGSFFKPHADGKETDLHYGTALLFPPGMTNH